MYVWGKKMLDSIQGNLRQFSCAETERNGRKDRQILNDEQKIERTERHSDQNCGRLSGMETCILCWIFLSVR